MRPRFLGETLRMRVGRWCGSSGRALVSRYAAGKVLGRTLIDQMQSFQHRFQRPFIFCSISTIRIRSKSRLSDSEYSYIIQWERGDLSTVLVADMTR